MAAAARGLAAVLFAFAAIVSGLGARAQDAWQTVSVVENAITIELPGAPKYTTTQLRSGLGIPYIMHRYMLEKGAVAYTVQTAVYPKDVDVANPQANLQGGLDTAARSAEGGKWTSVDWIRQYGHTAADAIGIRSGHAVRTYSVLKGRQFITLTYAGPPDTARSENAERFIKSLRLK